MARKPAKSKSTPSVPPAPTTAKSGDPRRRAVEALFRLAADAPYGAIGLADIAREASLSLADLRDLFPSKGAILGGLMRIIDREVLDGTAGDMDGETAHDRVLDIMLRRFDALAQYKEGLRSVHRSVRSDPVLALTLNQAAANSWRYMLEAAGVETQGPLGAMRTQGAILVFTKAFAVWLEDEPDLARTMATLDRELTRGESVMQWAGAVHRLAAPFRGFARAVCERRKGRLSDAEASEQGDAQYG